MSRQTQRKGDIGKAKAISTFTSLGYDVAILVTESAAYDLIVDTGENLVKVQCKFITSDYHVDLRSVYCGAAGYTVKKPKPGGFDWLYVLTAAGEEYLVKDSLVGRSSINMHEKFLLRKVAGNGA